MFASKLTLSDDLKYQKSYRTKILEYMQKYPQRCKNTTGAILARQVVNVYGGNPDTCRVELNKMTRQNMLYRYGNKWKSNFRINYMHAKMPKYILENAPTEVQAQIDAVEQTIEKFKDRKDVKISRDEEGCLTTKVIKPVEEKAEPTVEAPKVKETTVPVEVSTTKDGKNISITINLNITL